MGHGIRVFNADGTLQFDASSRLFRTLAVVDTGTSGGFVDVPTNQGAIAPVFVETGVGAQPEVSVAGGRVTWDWGSIPLEDRLNARLNVEAY